MPSLHKRKTSPYWIVAYTDAKGRRLKKSSKTTSYEEAMKIGREWEEAIRVAKKKRLVAKQHQSVTREIYEEPQSPQTVFATGQITPDNVPNQREIAKRLGVSQATVSMALRGDRSISQEMKRTVQETASQLGYHSNAYVNALMSRIRSGKRFSDKGAIAMLIDAPSMQVWHKLGSYRAFHSGVIRQSGKLGFHVETFCLRTPNMDEVKVDRILQARGIQGIILAPPYRGNRFLRISWEHYAVVAVGFGWENQEFDRVAYDNLQNYVTTFNALLSLGYRRIGTVLDKWFVEGSRRGVKWYVGYLDCQSRLPLEDRIPVCQLPILLGDEGELREEMFSPSFQVIRRRIFQEWLEKWRPDALLTIGGYEHVWLDSMGIKYPEEIGLVCLSEAAKPGLAKIDERAKEIGAASLELVAAKIARNEYGPPGCSKMILIEGKWAGGYSVKDQRRN